MSIEFYFDEGNYDEKPLPGNSRIVDRHIKGDFVIFQKTSTYNRITDTYDGRHNKMSTDEFRLYIEEKVEGIREALSNPKILRATSKSGVNINDFIFDVLYDVFHEETLSRFRDNDAEFADAFE